MKIKLTSVFVEDQDKALEFYTNTLGFVKKSDFPLGAFKWLTVVSPEEPNGPELLLEPDDNPAAKAYKTSIYEQGIPAAAFAVANVEGEYRTLCGKGVDFQMQPTEMPGSIVATFDDTCGNLIMIYEVRE